MSGINHNSLVFALPNDEDPEGKVVMCQMPIAMIMNWMFVVHPHVEKYRSAQDYYMTLAINSGINLDDSSAIIDFSNDAGMNSDVQILMMEVIADLRETMGDEDFLELYQMETTEEDDKFLSGQPWVGLNPDGTSHNAKLVDNVPKYENKSEAIAESDSIEQHD
jgi:predicted metal-dependent TIM-barrel fold hydrolase